MWDYGVKNPKFVIKPTRPYDRKTGLSKEKSFNADIYVLCYYWWPKNDDTMDATNLDHWKFWVFSQKQLLKVLDGRQSVTVKKLEEKLRCKPIDVFKLKDTILSL